MEHKKSKEKLLNGAEKKNEEKREKLLNGIS